MEHGNERQPAIGGPGVLLEDALQPAPSETPKPSRIAFLPRAAWGMFVVIALLGAAEYAARSLVKKHRELAPLWQEQARDFAAGPVDFIFIGSSRVAAAID